VRGFATAHGWTRTILDGGKRIFRTDLSDVAAHSALHRSAFACNPVARRAVYACMCRNVLAITFTVTVLALAGCNNASTRLRQRPAAAATLTPDARDKIERGVIEPGFTPEMVYLALGKPSSPAHASIEQTRDGTWEYRSFNRNERDFVRAGFRRRVVFDPVRKSDVIVTEPVDPRMFPSLQEHTLYVTFHDGRVTEVRRAAL
jgi:hypothetical protein